MALHRSLALGLAITAGLGASALAGANAPRKEYRPASPGVLHTSYTAVVTANGGLKRGVGAVTAMKAEGKGSYEVDFATDVTNCAYVVTVGEPDSDGSQPPSATTVVGRSGDPAGIFIETFDVTGTLQNMPFHVDVGC